MLRISPLVMALTILSSLPIFAQENRIDLIKPSAPELAAYGDYDIGVRTIEAIDQNRVDILNTARGEEAAYYDRKLTLEVWYPAQLQAGQQAGGQYEAITRNPAITATLIGKAVRDADALRGDGPYPLVIISHGYPGNRFLLSHLGENLASKGYVVASIDHRDSTYEDQQSFASTLYNRPLDQRFVLNTLATLSSQDDRFFSSLIDADNTGVVGYSMGGYGLVNNLGGGYSDEIVGSFMAPQNNLLDEHSTGNSDYRGRLDSRIKAGVAIAPWGMNANFWRSEDLANISTPALYIAGNVDTVAGYENGSRAIYEGAKDSERYMLTYKNAGHNAGAPYPLPLEIQNSEDQMGASHYTDPVWDTVTMNNILAHFATAYLDHHLKGNDSSIDYLDVVDDGANGVYSMEDGEPKDDHTYWKGFSAGTAVGLKLEHLNKGE